MSLCVAVYCVVLFGYKISTQERECDKYDNITDILCVYSIIRRFFLLLSSLLFCSVRFGRILLKIQFYILLDRVLLLLLLLLLGSTIRQLLLFFLSLLLACSLALFFSAWNIVAVISMMLSSSLLLLLPFFSEGKLEKTASASQSLENLYLYKCISSYIVSNSFDTMRNVNYVSCLILGIKYSLKILSTNRKNFNSNEK